MTIPGRRDPQLGLYRTDAPTTSPLAVMVVATLAASRVWYLIFFDVSTAFLSGKEIGSDGLRSGTGGWFAVGGRKPRVEGLSVASGPEGCLWFDGGAQAVVLEG